MQQLSARYHLARIQVAKRPLPRRGAVGHIHKVQCDRFGYSAFKVTESNTNSAAGMLNPAGHKILMWHEVVA